jgi:hypothetical protein
MSMTQGQVRLKRVDLTQFPLRVESTHILQENPLQVAIPGAYPYRKAETHVVRLETHFRPYKRVRKKVIQVL